LKAAIRDVRAVARWNGQRALRSRRTRLRSSPLRRLQAAGASYSAHDHCLDRLSHMRGPEAAAVVNESMN